ncbi:MAG: cell division protein FtsQ [Cyclobacteriaceae bacterium]
MKWSLKIRTEVKIVVALVGVSLLIAFGERKQNGIVCSNIVIELENAHENHFIDEADVLNILENSGQSIIGTSIDRLNLNILESQLKSDKHILDAELYEDVKGNLMVNVDLRRPIARLVRNDGPDAYIAEDGVVMSMSDKFSSRVLLITGAIVKPLIEAGDLYATEDGIKLMEMIHFINEDEFWKAQIAQVDFDSKGKAEIYPQVTGQLVEFGRLEDIEVKFKKLLIFYKEILPQRGWTKYDRVNVEFEGQVIAE